MTANPSQSPLGKGRGRLLQFKSLVANFINNLWPEPSGSFMSGILFGGKSGLPPELVENFNKTGMSHILAVSGYNITIIAVWLMAFLIAIGFWRRQAFWIVVGGLILFTALTGFSSSALRAMVMGILVLLAQYAGRISRIGSALSFAAAVMVLINPYVLVWDAGFQLSFLATLGLVYVSPVLSNVITRRSLQATDVVIPLVPAPNKSAVRRGIATLASLARNDALILPFISTLSAIIATLPLILYQFGRLSIVAPLVNILILWIIPFLMLFGFISIILGALFFPLGHLVAFIPDIGMKYVIIIVNFFGNQPWSAVEFNIPLWAMIIIYAVMVKLIYNKHYEKKNKSLSIR